MAVVMLFKLWWRTQWKGSIIVEEDLKIKSE